MRLYDATRTIAVAAGLLGAVMFYQPWVSGTVPGVGVVSLSGYDLAQGRAQTIADEASAPPPRTSGGSTSGAAPAPASGAGSLAMPTRVPTFAPGSQGAGSLSAPAAPPASGGAGGLTLPTRVPTFAPGSQAPGSLSAPGAPTTVATPAPPAPAAASGGLALPTRVPTFAPGSQAPGSLSAPAAPTVAATTAAGTTAPGVVATPLPIIERIEPAQLPKLTLYAVPLAGGGITIFTGVFGILRDPRDRRFARIWTILLGLLGIWTSSSVIWTIADATSPNNLLAPGEATAPLWAAWTCLVAFIAGTVALALAWTAREPSRA